MTMFWWARALKASHMEQARALLVVYARYEGDARDIELACGHLRAIVAVEDSVDKERGTLRFENARALGLEMLLLIGAIQTHYVVKSREPILEVLDDFEDKHRHIIYS